MYRNIYQDGGVPPMVQPQQEQGNELAQIYQMLMEQGVLGDMSFEQFQQLPPEQIQGIVEQVQGGGQEQQPQMQAPQMPQMSHGGYMRKYQEGGPKNPNFFQTSPGQTAGAYIGGTAGNLISSSLSNPEKSPLDAGNQASGIIGGASQGAMAGAAFGLPGMIIGGALGGIGGAITNGQEADAYRKLEDERQKARNVGILGQSYNPEMAYGGRAEKALVNRLKNRQDSYVANNTSNLNMNSQGVARAGYGTNDRPQYGPGGPFQKMYKRQFQKAFNKSGADLEQANNFMVSQGLPLVQNEDGSYYNRGNEANMTNPSAPYWNYESSATPDWRVANKNYRKMLKGKEYPTVQPARYDNQVPSYPQSPVGPQGNATFYNTRAYGGYSDMPDGSVPVMGHGGYFMQNGGRAERRIENFAAKKGLDRETLNNYMMSQGMPLTRDENNRNSYVNEGTIYDNNHPYWTYQPEYDMNARYAKRGLRDLIKGRTPQQAQVGPIDYTNQPTMNRPVNPTGPATYPTFNNTRAYGGYAGYGNKDMRGKC